MKAFTKKIITSDYLIINLSMTLTLSYINLFRISQTNYFNKISNH